MSTNIIAFCCDHCSYEAADRAGGLRKKYSESVKIIRVPCTGRIEPEFILKAFEKGADGLLILGCHPGNCHYREGNITALKRFLLLREVLRNLGIEESLGLSWVGAAEAEKFVEVINDFASKIEEKSERLKIHYEIKAGKHLETL